MKLKALLFVAAMAVTSTAMAATPIAVTETFPGSGVYSAEFSGSAATNTYSVDFSSLINPTLLNASVTSNWSGRLTLHTGSGYDVSSVTFDGNNFTPTLNTAATARTGHDVWDYSAATVSSSVHTLVVTGESLGGGGFTGSIDVSAAPEPAAWALMMVGVGGMGAALRTRRRKAIAA